MRHTYYFHQVPTLVDEDGYVISNTAHDFNRRISLVHWLDWDNRDVRYHMKRCKKCKAKMIFKRGKRPYCWVCSDLIKKYNEYISENPSSSQTLDEFLLANDPEYDKFH